MPIQVALNTPLADALSQAVQPKLLEIGWGNGGAEDAALAEYIILMLINGKTEQEIANDISGELLNLGPDDPAATEFARWLFQEIEILDAQLNGAAASVESHGELTAPSSADRDTAMDTAGDISELNVLVFRAFRDSTLASKRKLTRTRPTGPKSMRNGHSAGVRGGRERRLLGDINRYMNRAQDGLHRVRAQTGNERINSHRGGGIPTAPRAARYAGRQSRNMTVRPESLQAGFNAMSAQQMHPMQGMMQNGVDPQLVAIAQQFEQQNRLMQQILNSQNNNGFQNRRGGERGNHRGGAFNRGRQHQFQPHNQQSQSQPKNTPSEQTEDTEMDATKPEPANPEDTVCKFNLKCNNKDCKFAHQSPAAPPGITIDMNDICAFGAACKNFKCTGRHPSPAVRVAHQSDQDCKFFPNCQNPRCPFRHPSTRLCRNGTSCSTPNCKFTHVTTKCKFNPCLNPSCPFVHDEGQQGGFKDKVWTADSQNEHVSDRKFVDETTETEMVVPDADEDATII
jgi:hypothetical protein